MSTEEILSEIEDLVRGEATAFASLEEQQLAVEVARDLAQLHLRQLQGEDVAVEVGHAKAAAISLSSTAKIRLSASLSRVFDRVLMRLLSLVLPVV